MSGPEARLENTGSNSSPPREDRESQRWADRSLLWSVTKLPGLKNCGRAVRSSADGVSLRSSAGDAGWAGLQHCGSVWSCPVCAARILWVRSLEIGSTLGQALAEGHELAFVTLTMRHDRSQALSALWEACTDAWAKVTSGKAWTKHQKRYGVVGWVRVWEVTTGANGWHVHAHAVAVMKPGTSAANVEALGSSMFGRWSRSLQRSGLRAPLRKGQDWHIATGRNAAHELGKYLAKLQEVKARDERAQSLGMELAYTQPGRSRSAVKTRPVWSLLDDLRESGEVGRWREWEAASKGKRQVGWSKGLRERFGVIEEISDDGIVNTEVGTSSDTVAVLDVKAWSLLIENPQRPLQVLQAVRSQGVAQALKLLDGWGVAWSEPDPAKPSAGDSKRIGRSARAPAPGTGRFASTDSEGIAESGPSRAPRLSPP